MAIEPDDVCDQVYHHFFGPMDRHAHAVAPVVLLLLIGLSQSTILLSIMLSIAFLAKSNFVWGCRFMLMLYV